MKKFLFFIYCLGAVTALATVFVHAWQVRKEFLAEKTESIQIVPSQSAPVPNPAEQQPDQLP